MLPNLTHVPFKKTHPNPWLYFNSPVSHYSALQFKLRETRTHLFLMEWYLRSENYYFLLKLAWRARWNVKTFPIITELDFKLESVWPFVSRRTYISFFQSQFCSLHEVNTSFVTFFQAPRAKFIPLTSKIIPRTQKPFGSPWILAIEFFKGRKLRLHFSLVILHFWKVTLKDANTAGIKRFQLQVFE